MGLELYLDTMTLKTTPVGLKVRLAAEAGFAGPRIRGSDVREWEQIGGTAEGTIEELVRNFRVVCERAGSFGLQVGLGFIGHVPKVPDLLTAWRVVQAADRPNGGVVIDLFHFYRGGAKLEDITEVPAERILMVDLDDAMPLPRERLLGSRYRVDPGEGIADVRDVLRALLRHGFDGPVVVELFNEAYWAADPAVVAATAYRTARAVLETAEGGVA